RIFCMSALAAPSVALSRSAEVGGYVSVGSTGKLCCVFGRPLFELGQVVEHDAAELFEGRAIGPVVAPSLECGGRHSQDLRSVRRADFSAELLRHGSSSRTPSGAREKEPTPGYSALLDDCGANDELL